MVRPNFRAIAWVAVFAGAGCSTGAAPVSARAESVAMSEELAAQVRAALADAALRAPGASNAPRLVSAERLTWSDGSLGCPEPGRLYTQALVPGHRIRVEAGGVVHEYHAGIRGAVRWCAPGRSMAPVRDDGRI